LQTQLTGYAADNNQNGDIKNDTLDICILLFFLDRQFRGDVARKKSSCWILSVKKENVLTFWICLVIYHIAIFLFFTRFRSFWLGGIIIAKY